MNVKSYPEYLAQLRSQAGELSRAAPGAMSAFGRLHEHALRDGALPTRVKELIALAIGIAARCDGCIAYHVNGAIHAGATREEITEAVSVAILMGGGPATVYGAEALRACDEFGATSVAPPRD